MLITLWEYKIGISAFSQTHFTLLTKGKPTLLSDKRKIYFTLSLSIEYMGDAASLDADNNSRLPLRNTHTSIRNTQIDNLEEDDVPRNVEGIVNEAADDHEDDGSIVRNRRARGLNRPNWATESIEVVEFNARGQAIGPKKTVARWQRFLGLMAVDQGLFPIDVKDWRRFEHGTTLGDAWKRIKV